MRLRDHEQERKKSMTELNEYIFETIEAVRLIDPDINLGDSELSALLKEKGAVGILPHINNAAAAEVEEIFSIIAKLQDGRGDDDGR